MKISINSSEKTTERNGVTKRTGKILITIESNSHLELDEEYIRMVLSKIIKEKSNKNDHISQSN